MQLGIAPQPTGNAAAERRRLKRIVDKLANIERELECIAEQKKDLSERAKALVDSRRELLEDAQNPQLALDFDADDEVPELHRGETFREPSTTPAAEPKRARGKRKPPRPVQAEPPKPKRAGIDPTRVHWPDEVEDESEAP